MVEPESEPSSSTTEVAAPGLTEGSSDSWNRNTVFLPVDQIPFGQLATCVQLRRPSIAGDRAAAFIDREIVRFYRHKDGSLPDLRFYVVWGAPERFRPEDYAGLHFGVENRALQGIIASNCGVESNLEWERANSLSEGRRIFIQGIENHDIHIPGFKPWRVPIGHADHIYLWR